MNPLTIAIPRRAACSLAAALALLCGGCAVVPQPLEPAKLGVQAKARLERMIAPEQEPVTGAIDLYEAMARAIKYNLDYRVEMMEQALRLRDLDLRRFDMLPQVVAAANHNGRDSDAGGISRSLISGRESLEPSTSSERQVTDASLTLSWDVLDFGLGYVRAQQAADQVLVAEERKRKIVNRIVEDVRTAYWRTVSAERMLGRLQDLETEVDKSLANAREQFARRETAPLAALTYEREILTIRREIQSLQRELALAKRQLAALMNLAPETDYRVVLPERAVAWPALDRTLAQMTLEAVRNRPELREVSYQLRINERASDAALLELLPSLRAFVGPSWTSNELAYHKNWVGWGARASWNLINVFKLDAAQAQVRAQGELLDQRALALTMAVATQVVVSRAQYEHRQREVRTAAEYHAVQQKIIEQMRAHWQAERVSRQTLVREEMNSLVAEVRLDIALAELQNAFANVHASMGLDPFGEGVSSHDGVAALSAHLRRLWNGRGDRVAKEG
jgi:outer membrane protein TolC